MIILNAAIGEHDGLILDGAARLLIDGRTDWALVRSRERRGSEHRLGTAMPVRPGYSE
jgi:hypothetical protein